MYLFYSLPAVAALSCGKPANRSTFQSAAFMLFSRLRCSVTGCGHSLAVSQCGALLLSPLELSTDTP